MYNNLSHWAMSYSNINEWEDRIIIIIIGLRHHLYVHAYVYTYIKIYSIHIYAYVNAYIHIYIHTHTHAETYAFWEVGLTRRSEDHSLHPSLIHITKLCKCVCICLPVWRKMWEGREAWTWIWEKSLMLLSLFQICAWKHIFKCLVHWLSWPTAKQEEIHNIKGTLWEWKYLRMYFLFFPVLVLICHIPDNWQEEKVK